MKLFHLQAIKWLSLLDMFGANSLPSIFLDRPFSLRFAAEVNGLGRHVGTTRRQKNFRISPLCVWLFSIIFCKTWPSSWKIEDTWGWQHSSQNYKIQWQNDIYNIHAFLEASHNELPTIENLLIHVVFPIPPLPSPCWSEDKAKMSTTSCTDVIPPSTNMSKPAAALPKERNHVHDRTWKRVVKSRYWQFFIASRNIQISAGWLKKSRSTIKQKHRNARSTYGRYKQVNT